MVQDSSPHTDSLPEHIAIIMDGNGRWARARHLPRTAGHKRGVETTSRIVRLCGEKGIRALTLFAFSSENWRRPQEEVSTLMELFVLALKREIKQLNRNNVRLRFIGDRSAFGTKLQAGIQEAEQVTSGNTGLQLQIAANYGGRWDIVQAARQMARAVQDGSLSIEEIDEQQLAARISTADLPEPDLFIRTGGEHRISNFLLWQLAYSELYFTDVLWPDFSEQDLDTAIDSFARRQRRFGMTGEQVEEQAGA
jgi:undecaprenyl diphosphate synthase